jgi:hypothetical protein
MEKFFPNTTYQSAGCPVSGQDTFEKHSDEFGDSLRKDAGSGSEGISRGPVRKKTLVHYLFDSVFVTQEQVYPLPCSMGRTLIWDRIRERS